ncbi:MAG: ABC transporter substrate-binding protein [Anaerolineae bacterium]
MHNRFKFMAFLLVLALLVVAPVTAQDGGNTFTFGEFGNPVQLDPAVVTDGISFRTASQGCEPLLSFVGSTTDVGPGLAQSWETSEDGLTWTFQLVENATFHDGTPFNAEAVVWNFERWRFTDNPFHFAEQVYEYYDYMFGLDDASYVTNVEATGEYEVTFTLREPNGSFLNTLAMPMFAISSPAAVEEFGTAYGTPEVGYVCTGPFRFVEWISDERVVLERNPDYWGEIPGNVDTIIFQIIPDNAARFAALQSGAIDGFEQPNVEDLEAIEGADDLYLITRGPLNVMYLAFNYRVQEFRDPLVRQAISMAMNREEIVAAFYPPGAIAAATMLPPSLWGFNANIPVMEYDPEGAMALLAEAGYPDGISEVNVLGVDENGNVTDEVVDTIPVDLFFQPVTRPYNPDGEGIGEAMVSYLADIGIEANLASAGDWATYLDRRASGDLIGMYQLGWTGDNGDPDNFLGYFFAQVDTPKAAEGFYQNTELAEVLMQARALPDQESREPLYQQAEQILYDETGRIFIAHTGVPLAFNQRVSGYVTNPLGTELFKFVSVE